MGGGNGVPHSRRGAVSAITSLSLCCSVLGGCASAPPSIGLFEDGTEIFYGDAAPAYDSDARLFVGTGRFYFRGSESGLECEGLLGLPGQGNGPMRRRATAGSDMVRFVLQIGIR